MDHLRQAAADEPGAHGVVEPRDARVLLVAEPLQRPALDLGQRLVHPPHAFPPAVPSPGMLPRRCTAYTPARPLAGP